MVTAKDCVTCGACCVAPASQPVYCNITEADARKLGKRFVRLRVVQPSAFDRFAHALDGREVPWGVIKTNWVEQKDGPFKGLEFNTCVALKGSVSHKVSCSIYEKRPEACKTAMKPGDPTCLRLRKMFSGVVRER